ncbi:MAG: hypothetical protein SFY66_03295 [Oculatellaceae cyanobacterium bins.114]|nr:hypothetical protein [Oculatellaceae cyanobacterium bins.114]
MSEARMKAIVTFILVRTLMADQLPPIYFYLPKYKKIPPELLKADVLSFWKWQSVEGRWKVMKDGEFAWVMQTYLRLREANFPCQLTGTLPEQGIVLAHRRSLPYGFKPTSKVLVICIEADQPSHPFAQCRVVQNPTKLGNSLEVLHHDIKVSQLTSKASYFMPHWPQIGLIPRDLERGDRFENIDYFGTGDNLAPELLDHSWADKLQDMGLTWHFRSRDHYVTRNSEQINSWNDYSSVDAVVAVRNFHGDDCTHKPATKLYNCWHAGVPAILGPDSAFRAERKSELDYIEVTSIDDLITALSRLQWDKKLYQNMIENGKRRAQETTTQALVNRWSHFLMNVAVPAYDRWRYSSHFSQQWFLFRCQLYEKVNSIKHRLPVQPTL